MLSVYQTLSVRYLSRRWVRAVLIIASIALGVATLVATQALNDTMTRASLARINPMPGVADFVVGNSQLPISSDLAETLKKIPGVKDAWPRIFDNVRIPELDNRTVLIIGIDKQEYNRIQASSLAETPESNIILTEDRELGEVLKDAQELLDDQFKNNKFLVASVKFFLKKQSFLDDKTAKLISDYLDRLDKGKPTDEAVLDIVQKILPPVMVGGELVKDFEQLGRKDTGLVRALSFLPDDARDTIVGFITGYMPERFTRDAEKVLAHRIVVQQTPQSPRFNLLRVGTVKGEGHAAVLGSNVLVLYIEDAARILEMQPGKVNRIDITLHPDANKDKVLEALQEAARGYGEVRTPKEQGDAMGSALQGMQTGFSLCGLAALVVGLFLVYNALSVCVTERRHEIGMLRAMGATRRQIHLIFAGEAAFLGLAGSLIGIPLGIGLAYLGLQPVQDILRDVFVATETNQVEVGWYLMFLALSCGMITAVAAGLFPAVAASRENPASAVRQISKAPTWGNLSWQICCSLGLFGAGVAFIVFRQELSDLQRYWSGARQLAHANQLGTFGGMILVLLGALLAAPLLAALIARILQPVARRWFPITWRLAADNLVLSPGRTGLVIAALSAGVALVTQTYGTIVSNRTALSEWVKDAIAADLIVSLGSPIGAGQAAAKESMGPKMAQIEGVEAVLPMCIRKIPFRNTEVKLFALDAGGSYKIEKKRKAELQNLELYKTLSETPNTAIISENFSALHGVGKGDFVTLNAGDKGEVKFMVVGKMLDYTWNHGTIFIDLARFKELWGDTGVDIFDVFVRQDDLSSEAFAARVEEVRGSLRRKFGETGLVAQTRKEMQDDIENLIERLYSIALVQQFIVILVSFFGVILALLISVLQRRREMGLLRAIGASRAQVVRSVLAEACLMGIIGTIIGLAVGIPLQWYVLQVVILEESGYLFPVLIPWVEGLAVAVVAMGTATLAGLGPALYAVRLRIPDAIAYE